MSAERGRPAVVSALASGGGRGSGARSSGRRQFQTLGYLPCAETQPLSHHDRIPLVLRERGQRPGQRGHQLGLVRLGLGQRDPIELEVGRYRATTPTVRSCVKHTFFAIAVSHAASHSGLTPRRSARSA